MSCCLLILDAYATSMKRAVGCHVNQRVHLSPVSLIWGCQPRRQLQPADLTHALYTHTTPMIRASQGPIKSGSDFPTDEELYAWTMRREAIASCLIEDIFHLRQSPAKSESPGLVLAIFCNKPSQATISTGWAACHVGL